MALYDDILNNYLEQPKQEIPTPAPAATAAAIPDMQRHDLSMYTGGGAMENMFKILHKDEEPESAEQAAARENRERRNSTLMALADGLSGIANVWGATKGATPIRQESLSQANKFRYDYAKREREANKDAWRRGIMNSRLQDLNSRAISEEKALKRAEQERERQYKISQDKKADVRWGKEFELRETTAKQNADLSIKKFDEGVRSNKVREGISGAQLKLAREKAESALNNPTGTGMGKTIRFGLSDGTNIQVPDDMKGSYVADVYKKMVASAGGMKIDANGQTANPILSFMKFQYGQKEPGLSEMMTAIQLYKDDYPGIEAYMTERASQYINNYSVPQAKGVAAPGSPGTSNIPLPKTNWGQQPLQPLQPQQNISPLTDDDLSDYLIE